MIFVLDLVLFPNFYKNLKFLICNYEYLIYDFLNIAMNKAHKHFEYVNR
jgi:hypothetical protein